MEYKKNENSEIGQKYFKKYSNLVQVTTNSRRKQNQDKWTPFAKHIALQLIQQFTLILQPTIILNWCNLFQ